MVYVYYVRRQLADII